MQIHQRMDLDQINEDNSIKPRICDENQSQNNSANTKKNHIGQKRKSNRVFGADITNKQRQIANNNENTKNNKNNRNNDDGFNFVKPIIVIKSSESNKSQKESEKDSETKIKRKLNMEQDIDDECDDDMNDSEIEMEQELAIWDNSDVNDDLFVTDYVSDIMCNLRGDESINRGGCIIESNCDFMVQQKDINGRMRTVLVDWLVEVHRKFKLLSNTYFLGINLLDRYLVKKQLHRRKLQLCGCTCLWIASKYHEIYAPEMDDFVYISDNAFNDQDLMNMEIDILKTLSFTLTVPTVFNYAQRYTKISAYYLKKEREIKIISDLIMYCNEHCVMSYDLCRLKPSLIGAACFVYSCISTKVFTKQTFKNDNIDKVIGYTFNELIPIMNKIDCIVRNAKKSKHKAVYKKYCNNKYSNIGKLNFEKLNTSFLHK